MRSPSRGEAGATAVEYALMLAAFSGAILFMLSLVGNSINRTRSNMGEAAPGESAGSASDGGFIHSR
jgi:Flp pilus assembly pilin Flp